MLHTEITRFPSGIHKELINTLRGRNAGFENVNTGGTRSKHRTDEG